MKPMLTSKRAGRPIAYYEALKAIRELDPRDRLDILVDITSMIRLAPPPQPRHSVLELEGLGAELWQRIDVDEYIEAERASWNG